MSRTYRKRKAQWKFEVYDYVRVENSYTYEKIIIKKDSVEYSKQKAKFHKDGKEHFDSVPGWFVNLYCQRSFRQNTKKHINQWIRNPEKSTELFPEFIKDAGWYWY